MKVNGKTFVITGGGNGIGRELTLQLLKKGASVAAVDLNETALEETKQLAGSLSYKLSLHALNITNKQAVDQLPEQIISRHKQIDGLINNAGIIQPFVRINSLNFDAIERVINVNFYGTLYMIKAFLPHLLKRSEAHIANVSSMGGFLPVPGQSIYGASKAAVKLMTEALYAELLETNVKVSIIFPGAIGTNITVNSGVEAPKMSEEDMKKSSFKPLPVTEAANIIINGIENNKERIFVGGDSKFMNFLYRLSPGFATRFIAKQMKSLLSD